MGKEMDKIILITGASRGIGKALANKIKGKKIVTIRDIKSLDGVGDHPYDLDHLPYEHPKIKEDKVFWDLQYSLKDQLHFP